MASLCPDNIEVGCGSSQRSDAFQAGVEAVEEALLAVHVHRLSVVLVFASVTYDLEELLAGVRSRAGDAPVLGATTAGEICNRPLSGSVVVAVLASPHLTVKWALGHEVSTDWRKAVREVVESPELGPYFSSEAGAGVWQDLTRNGKTVFGLLLSPGNTRCFESSSLEILEELRRAARGRLPFLGAGAADDWRMEANYVLCGDSAFLDSLLVAVFETRLQVGMGSSHGFRPSKLRATATHVNGREVLRLNGLPAADVYADLLGTDVSGLEGKHLTLSTGRPFGVRSAFGHWDPCVASYFTPVGGIRLSQPVMEGSVLSVMETNVENLVLAGCDALRNGIMQGQVTDPALVLVFSCALRSRYLKEKVSEEIESMREALPEVPMVGFYSFGEQAPGVDGVCRHCNETVALLVLGRGFSAAAEVALENERLLESQRLSEKQIRESRQNLETLLSSVDDLILVLDGEGAILSVNPTVVRLLGHPKEKLESMRIEDLHPPDCRGELLDAWSAVRADADRSAFWTLPMISCWGERIEIETRVSGGTWNGRPAMFAVCRDVSERVRAQQLLKEGRERLELALEGADVGIWDWNLASGELVYGERWTATLGYSCEEIPHSMLTWAELVHASDRSRVGNEIKRHLKGLTSRLQVEYRMRLKRGGWKWILTRGKVTERSMDGRALRMVGTYMDITERKESEISLRLFRQLIDATSQAVAIYDREGRLTYINPAHEKLFGRSLGEAERLHDLDLYTFESSRILTNRVLPLLARGEGWEGQLDAFDAEGRKFTLWVRADAICDAERKLLYSFRIMHDMTDLKESEARRLDMERRIYLNRKRESLGNLAGGVAHHFNNLLMAVQGNLELVQEDLQHHHRSFRMLCQAREAARRAQNLSGLMLTYLGHGVGIKSLCNLSEELSRIVPLVARSVPPTARIRTILSPALPLIKADAENLRLVALNLFTNAWEALGEEGGEVVLATGTDFCDEAYLRRTVGAEALKEGDYVFLEVRDDGCGMDPETVAQMFDPFFSTKFTGRGLGLASVLGIVEGHQGAVVVTSAPGMGTTVRALFPPAGEWRR